MHPRPCCFLVSWPLFGRGGQRQTQWSKRSIEPTSCERPDHWWKLWGISLLMILGFMLVVATLAFVVFGPEVGGYVQSLTGLPDAFLALWGTLRWALAFLAVTLAHDLLYYLAPNARIPFKWITPAGFTATVLILLSSAALNLYVVNFARYNQIYGQVGAIIVLMVWLYSTGLMVLIGAEINAVLVRMAEERKNTELVQAESPANEKDR